MTNDPTYPEQLELLKKYKGFGGDEELPGTPNQITALHGEGGKLEGE